MPEIAVKDMNNQSSGSLKLSDELFGIKGRDPVMHEAVVGYLANQRQGTHATKTKGKVRGGGKKPWRQKGTGRARAGSNRSPLWRGGGTTFGPQPRDYSVKMPRQARKLALYAAISRKIADGQLVAVDSLTVEEPRTKKMVGILKNLGLEGGSLLIVLKEQDANVVLSARNIPGVRVKRASDLHTYDVLAHERLLVSADALKTLERGAGE